MKYYVVKKGNNPGIYSSWEECEKEIKGYKGAIFKSFNTYEDAKMYLDEKENNIEGVVCYIDGSYDKVTENYSFGGVLLKDGVKYTFKKKYLKDEFSKYHNVAGEIKGAAFILNYCVNNNIKEITICYDYLGIEKWYDGSWKALSDIAKLYVNFVLQIKDKIKVNFIKIKSHTNNLYNDLADKLAKEALGI